MGDVRLPTHRMSDFATKRDVVNAVQTIVLPLCTKIDEQEARIAALEAALFPETVPPETVPTDSEGEE